MSEKEMVEKEAGVNINEPETIDKAEYEKLAKDYLRVSAAFSRAITIIANDYAEKVAKAIFDEIDKKA